MSFDVFAISRGIRELGSEIARPAIDGTAALYAQFHEREPYHDVSVERDIRYGAHERHRLDVFAPQGAAAGKRAVLVFVHGGGFVAGDKKFPGSPYNDNVALWAVRHDLIGVTITYRLAPQFGWPSGAEDVAAAIGWVRAHVAQYGGDPDRVFLMGTSAGAAHVAAYVANRRFHPAGAAGIAGAALLSGIYDFEAAERTPYEIAYLGTEDARYREASALRGLVETTVPLMFVLTEMDPPGFQRQGLELVNAYVKRHGRWPRFVWLSGHNHFSSTMHLNTPDEYLGQQILDFMSTCTSARDGTPV